MSTYKLFGTPVEINTSFTGAAPITEQALNFIQKHSAGTTILEIGCGSGIYAKLLREKGIKVIATDACRINREGLPSPTNRMAEFSNIRAIPNMIEENAVSAVEKFGQNTDLSLFLSFPIPSSFGADKQYDETALRNFKGNKFFLIAYYGESLSGKKKYDATDAHNATGSFELHDYLEKEWNLIDIELLETGRMRRPNIHTYLIYFERKKTTNMPGGTNRKCPKNNAKDLKLKTVKKGLDGNMWIVSKRSDGVIFWKRK
jgi:SAM-dependent methyltransferase